MKYQISRRTFLKTSSALAALAALSACSSGGTTTNTAKPYGYQVITIEPLTIELGSITGYNSVEEFRFRITNNGTTPVTLSKENFTAQFNGKDAPFCAPDEPRTDFPELFSQMPIPAGGTVRGYVAFHASLYSDSDSYKVTIRYGGKEAVFASQEKEKEWYE